MPKWIQLGRRRFDLGLMIDFHKKRAIVRANTAWITGGIDLEIIPSGANDYAPGMVLINRDWHELYFLIEREGWDEDDYFEYAAKRLKELKVEKP